MSVKHNPGWRLCAEALTHSGASENIVVQVNTTALISPKYAPVGSNDCTEVSAD